MLIFHREPALWLALVASVVSLTSEFVFHMDDAQQGVINAVAVALVGLITAWSVDKNGLSAAILGLLGSVLSLALAFGAHLSPSPRS
jgi:intracellular septation protein A